MARWWHGGEDDPVLGGAVGSQLDRRVRVAIGMITATSLASREGGAAALPVPSGADA
jgi:hypothetical protein